jgi:hypothetical protein
MDEQYDSSERPWVRIHTLENRFEADLLLHALEQEGIPVRLRTYEETAYDGLFVLQRGWGALFVPGDCEDSARELIRRVLTSAPREPVLDLAPEEGESVTNEPGLDESA